MIRTPESREASKRYDELLKNVSLTVAYARSPRKPERYESNSGAILSMRSDDYTVDFLTVLSRPQVSFDRFSSMAASALRI
jgi:hypothetical protein